MAAATGTCSAVTSWFVFAAKATIAKYPPGKQASAVIPLYLGYGWPVAVFIALVFCALAGLSNGFLVAYVGMQPIVATLALFVGGRGFAQVLVDGQLQTISDGSFLALWRATLLGVPVPVVVSGVLAVIVGFLVRRTTFGRYVLAVGGNRRASYLSGHPVRGVLLAVYAISGVSAGIAGTFATVAVTYVAGKFGIDDTGSITMMELRSKARRLATVAAG